MLAIESKHSSTFMGSADEKSPKLSQEERQVIQRFDDENHNRGKAEQFGITESEPGQIKKKGKKKKKKKVVEEDIDIT